MEYWMTDANILQFIHRANVNSKNWGCYNLLECDEYICWKHIRNIHMKREKKKEKIGNGDPSHMDLMKHVRYVYHRKICCEMDE